MKTKIDINFVSVICVWNLLFVLLNVFFLYIYANIVSSPYYPYIRDKPRCNLFDCQREFRVNN